MPKTNADRQRSVIGITLTVLFFVSLTVFCYSFGYSFGIPLILLYFGIHLYACGRRDYKLYWSLGILLVCIFLSAHAILHYATFSYLYIPVAAISIFTALLFKDLHLTFLMSVIAALIVSFTIGLNMGDALTFFLGALTAGYTVREARTRGRLMMAGLFVSGIHVACVLLLDPDLKQILTLEFAKYKLYPLVANGFISAFIVLSTLKVFEYLFGNLTNFSLLELADFNHPILRRMILEAPGTYHHSLVVSNLAEAAADEIGADALLTRVGAYYHDIGKMARSEYFTENQMIGGNVHDKIEPSMSRLVILNHVKEGVELAKKYKLNQVITDFIPQHHGTSLIHYFYQRALEEAQNSEEVEEVNFRYPGPKPQTRETAICLLADSVEGATRALDNPDAQAVEEIVQKVINNKFIDGQLDECPLTLKEINAIAKTFTRILTAMHHGRVKYPEAKNGKNPRNGHSHQQSAGKGSPQHPGDPHSRRGHPSH